MITTIINGKIPGPNGRPIVYDLIFETNGSKAPIVIFCHGYKGYKDWGAWTLFAKDFASQGIAFLKFNFSYNGGTSISISSCKIKIAIGAMGNMV